MKEKKSSLLPFKIKKKYEKDSSFSSHYVTGALGGFRNPYDFRLAFYNIDTTNYILKTQKFKQNKSLTEEQLIEKFQETEMKHKILCEVIMTEKTAREIYKFLGKELKALEEMKKEGEMEENK